MFYPLFCASCAIETYDYGQDFHFYHKTGIKGICSCRLVLTVLMFDFITRVDKVTLQP